MQAVKIWFRIEINMKKSFQNKENRIGKEEKFILALTVLKSQWKAEKSIMRELSVKIMIKLEFVLWTFQTFIWWEKIFPSFFCLMELWSQFILQLFPAIAECWRPCKERGNGKTFADSSLLNFWWNCRAIQLHISSKMRLLTRLKELSKELSRFPSIVFQFFRYVKFAWKAMAQKNVKD